MGKYLLFAGALLIGTNVCAQPNEINIIGLIPGVSTKLQVEAAQSNHENGLRNRYIIGGFSLNCTSEYIDRYLSLFVCHTGEDWGSTDETKEPASIATNEEVHNVLVRGFTKKFGSPTNEENTEIRNGIGLKFNQQAVGWKDQKGNLLILINIMDKTTRGALVMRSFQKLKVDTEKQSAKNSQRAF